MSSRVFVTGLGVASTVGLSAAAFWAACLRGESRVESVPAHWARYYESASKVWSSLPWPAIERRFKRADLLTLDRIALLAIHASDEALRDAGLPIESTDLADRSHRVAVADPHRAGVYVGTGFGGARASFDNHLTHLLANLRALLDTLPADTEVAALAHDLGRALREHPRVHPMVICQSMPNACAALLGIRHGFKAQNDTACCACASGTVAIGRAFRAIRAGDNDLCLAGGVEHLGDHAGSVFMGFDRLRTLARPLRETGSENRPFDEERSGFLFSEGGAGFVVLESERHAERRGARPVAEILGFGTTSDAHSIVAIAENDNTIPRMIGRALEDAALTPDHIGYINAHGTSTELNDAVEAALIARHFPQRPIVNSTKAIVGHTIGACGALEVIATALSLREQRVHGMPNLTRPVGGLDYATASRAAAFDHALTHNFGFGGHNAGLVLKRFGPLLSAQA